MSKYFVGKTAVEAATSFLLKLDGRRCTTKVKFEDKIKEIDVIFITDLKKTPP